MSDQTKGQTTTGTTTDGEGQSGPLLNSSGGGSGAQTVPEWMNSLPDDIKGEAALKQFKDVGSLAKSYAHLNKKRNESLLVPGADAKPEDWDSFYTKIGRPESADKYELKVPDGVKTDDALIKGFRERAFKSGILPKQAQEVLDFYHEANKQALDTYEKQSNEAVDGLRKKWAGDFDKNVAYANAALHEFGGKEIAEQLEKSAWGKYPPLVELLASIGKGMAEKPLHGQDSAVSGQSAKDLDSEIASIQANPAFLNRNHPEHQTLIQRRNELYELRYPSPKE